MQPIMAPRAVLTIPTHLPRLPLPCPWPRTHWAATLPQWCLVARPVYSFPQPCPVQPWDQQRWDQPQTQVPTHPQFVPVPRELPDVWICSCRAPGWGDGTGPGCQALPSPTWERPPSVLYQVSRTAPIYLELKWGPCHGQGWGDAPGQAEQNQKGLVMPSGTCQNHPGNINYLKMPKDGCCEY